MRNIFKHKGKKKTIIAALGICTLILTGAGITDNYFEISKNLEIFTGLYRELNIYYVDETQPGELMKTGIDAMLESLDPYTVYFPESKIEDYRFMTTGQYGGIGALVQTIDDQVIISEPYEGYAAEKAGLIAGDIIMAVDGKSVLGKNQEEISDILKGQAGTRLTVRIKRPGTADEFDVELKREEVKIPDVPYSGMLDDKTGYIQLNSFTKTASSEVRKAFTDLKNNEGMEQLIFDLRGNGGGLLREAVNIVNLFVPKETEIVSTRGKMEEWNKSYSALREPEDLEMPVIVLVDGSSASASEIVSGTLQDLDRAVVIGTRTFGKGLVQQTKDISYNTKLKLTVAKYYIPSGRCIQKLDYSNKEDGQAAELPDSLIKPYYTAIGRPVFDGRGIKPDVEINRDEASQVISGLLQDRVIFKYATQYRLKHDSIPSPEKFKLKDKEYGAFKDFALDHDFHYETETEYYYKKLKEVAEEERYLEGAEQDFEQLFKKLKPNKEEALRKFKSEILKYLENEIVGRYYYQKGRIKYSLDKDPYIEEALATFGPGYAAILSAP